MPYQFTIRRGGDLVIQLNLGSILSDKDSFVKKMVEILKYTMTSQLKEKDILVGYMHRSSSNTYLGNGDTVMAYTLDTKEKNNIFFDALTLWRFEETSTQVEGFESTQKLEEHFRVLHGMFFKCKK